MGSIHRSRDDPPEYDADSGIYYTHHDWTSDTSVTHAVVRAVGAITGKSPAGFDTTLFDVIDTDALEALFKPTNADERSTAGGVWFTFDDHTVIVESDGTIAIHPPDDPH